MGLITNPTGVDNNMKSTIDILHEAKNVQLVALFAPESIKFSNLFKEDLKRLYHLSEMCKI